jgi:DNA helicase IV
MLRIVKTMDIQSESDRLQKILKEINRNSNFKNLSVLLAPFIIGIFLYIHFENKLKDLQKQKSDIIVSLITSLSEHVKYAISRVAEVNKNDTYLIYQNQFEINSNLDRGLKVINDLISIKNLLPEDFNKIIITSQSKISEIQKQIINYNGQFVENRIMEYDYLFKKSPFPLDENQKRAVIIDDKHNLVVAGAGSGKTEVLITRIAYLIERKPDTISPERIVALAFQNKAANEMKQRLKERYGFDVKIKTFHALGKEILEKSSDKPPRLLVAGDNYDTEFKKCISMFYQKLMNEDNNFQVALIEYMKYFGDEEKTETDFRDKKEYYDYLRSLKYTGLNGTKVKSYAEQQILNYLLTHSINGESIPVEYEKPAQWMEYTNSRGQKQTPKPDFFLPRFDLYWEHWAINQNGNVPEWFGDTKTSERYKWGMEQKKLKFLNQAKYGLIESFGYEIDPSNPDDAIESKLLKKLKEKYPDKTFEISLLPFDQIVNDSWYCRESLKSITGDIANFITIAKTYNLCPKDIQKRLENEKWTLKQLKFSRLALILYEKYQQHLILNNYIDFSDMINLAVKALIEKDGFYENAIDHILVDEYQDISAQRYNLIKALMNKNKDCKLFCVGDDWQSIMGFTGSNVDYFVNFDNYFDHPIRTDLTTNYRSTKPIVDTGAEIIRNNGDVQLIKETNALKQDGKPVKIVLLSDYWAYYNDIARNCIDTIEKLLLSGYEPQDIMILARILKNPFLNKEIIEYARSKNIPVSIENHNDPHNVPYMTVHRSKGLQARVVFILNVRDDMYGFPCGIVDSRIYEPAIIGRKKDRIEEERRLFYVAVTRAKEEVIIYSLGSSRSQFIKEISQLAEISRQ